MFSTIFLSQSQENENKSDAYKFLMSKVPQAQNIPWKSYDLHEFHPSVKIQSLDFTLYSPEINNFKNENFENYGKRGELDQDLFEEKIRQLDHVTIGEIDNPFLDEEFEAWVVLKDTDNEDNMLGLFQKQTSQIQINHKNSEISSRKLEPISEKSWDDTYCCENLREPVKAKQKNEKENIKGPKRSPKTMGTPNADWNYFSLRRACFRGMSAYFKEKFNLFVKKSGLTKSLK